METNNYKKTSFSMKVKGEAAGHISSRLHCQIAEISAMLGLCATIRTQKNGRKTVQLQTENALLAKKCFTLLKKAFSIENVACVVQQGALKKESRNYSIILYKEQEVQRLLSALRLESEGKKSNAWIADPVLLQSECCKRAFLRGAFLAVGSVSDPEKSYHLEFVCTAKGQAMQLSDIIRTFGIEAHMVVRKKTSGRVTYVVYIKEGDGIGDLLNIFQTHLAMLDMVDVRIRKDIANSVNRIVNCETANIQKTIEASAEQIADILFLEKEIGLEQLPDELRDIARMRLSHRDISLKELGQLMEPSIGKSGVNHRLRKIKSLADQLRSEKEFSDVKERNNRSVISNQ